MKKVNKKLKKQTRVRVKVQGTTKVPRLSVYRSNQAIYAQLIDDSKGQTIVGVSQRHLNKKTATTETRNKPETQKFSGSDKFNDSAVARKMSRAREVGLLIAKLAKKRGITRVVFDRGSYRYHGRVKQVADGAREGGLEF